MSERKCDNWIRSYALYAKEQESPEIYHWWTAIFCLSTALERNVWIDRGYMLLYPNLYILFVAETASTRKTTAILMGADILREALPDINYIPSKESPEGMLKLMSEEYEKTKVSAGCVISDEVVFFLGNTTLDPKMLEFLTALYTCPRVCTVHTLKRGKETCNNPCLNLLGGATPQLMNSRLSNIAVSSGFTGRVIFVFQDKGWVKTPWPVLPKDVRADLVEDLKLIREIKGEYKLTEEALEYFNQWYVNVHDPDAGPPSMKGYYSRKHDTLLKVAMSLAAAERSELMVERRDIELALQLLDDTEGYIPGILEQIEATRAGEIREKVLGTIARKAQTGGVWVEYSIILRALSYCMSASELRDTLQVLLDEETIEEMEGQKGRRFRIREEKK